MAAQLETTGSLKIAGAPREQPMAGSVPATVAGWRPRELTEWEGAVGTSMCVSCHCPHPAGPLLP